MFVAYRRVLSALLCSVLLAALVPVSPALATGGALQNSMAPSSEYIVILKDSASVAAKVNKETSLGNDVNDVFASKVKGFVAELDAADVRRLQKDSQVLIVEPNSVMSIIDTQEPSTTSSSTTSTSSTSSSSTTTSVPISTTSTIAALQSPDDLEVGDAIPDEYIVTLRDGVGAMAFAAAQADGGADILGIVTSAINGFGARLDKSQLALLANDPNVKYIEENTVVGITGDQANPPSWGLDRIDQRSRTLNQNYSYNYTGAGVNVYIIDTGVRSDHRDFGGRVVAGSTQVSDGRGTEDCNGHGTHVAGTVAGQTYGVAKAARIVPIRVLSCTGRGSMFNVITGVNWMIENHLAGVPAVANLSLGGSRNASVNQAVANAVRDGITVVVAAGNSNRDASTFSPASEPLAITVGATMSTDGRASYSNFGPLLDIFAPGSAITSAFHRSSSDIRSLSGTSMAAPHVAGAAALMLEENPSRTPAQVMEELAAYATPDLVTNPGVGSVNRLLYTHARWMPPTPEAPSAPQSLVAVGGVGQATLTWIAPTQTGSGSITDYLIEFSSTNGATWTTFADGVTTATTATVSGLTNGISYSFRVSAVNASGNSPASEVARAVVGVPTAPTGLVATAGAAQVALRWTAPTANGGSAITDYIVEFSADGGSVWSTFDDGVSTALTATVTGLVNGVTHTFRVSALNVVGSGGVSSSAAAVPWQVNSPSSPRALIVTSVMATSIGLEWLIPTTDGGGFITGYVVEQSTDGVNWSTSRLTGLGGRHGGIWFATAYDLVSGTEYRFRVRATNSNGNSEPSSPTSPRAAGISSEPEDVRAVEARPRSIMLRWERPLSDGGSAIRGYTIEYSVDAGTSWTTWPVNTGVEGCVCQYMSRTVTDLTDGLAHIFRVRAYNAVGTSSASEATDPLVPLTPAVAGQPTNVVGTATPAVVELDWDGPASDGGAPITDYVVEYSTDGATSWSVFADGTSTATFANLRGLAVGVIHIFRVSAVNSAGRGAASTVSSGVVPMAALVNDAFSGAVPIVCESECLAGAAVRLTTSTRSATREPGEPNHGGYGGAASIWYSFSLARAGSVVIDTYGSNFDTLLGVYTGSAVNALTTVIANDDASGGNWSRVELASVIGTTYWVAIDGYGGRTGSTVLNWRFSESAPAEKPDVPRNVRAVGGNARATVYWSTPSSDGGAAITAYTATASPGGRTCITAGALTCEITGLTNGTAYTFVVTATNSAGTSDASLASEPITPSSGPTEGVTTLSWGLDRIDQRSLPLDSRYTRAQSGAGVTVYVIDTGVRSTHSELVGRVATGFSTISDGNGSQDCHGHGTHVAGTVAGTNYGVAPAALVVPVRVLNCSGSASTSDIIAGIDWIITHHQAGVPAVANMSLGGSRSAALDLAVARGVADGVSFVVAAGNSNLNACQVSPAGEPLAITVGSTTSTDERSSFSNFGACLDVFAPGSNITSAGHTNDSATRTFSGTSMAAPHVAGVAALALGQNPALTPADVAAAIATSSTRNVVTNPGVGSLNRLVYSLLTPAPTAEDEPPPTTTPPTTPPPPPRGDDGGGDDGGDSTPPPNVPPNVPRNVPTTVPMNVPTTVPTAVPAAVPATVPLTRSQMPAAGARPAVGSAIPRLPTSVREFAPVVRLVGGNLRVAVTAPKGALVHVYHNGALVRSVTAEQAKNLMMPANGAAVSEMQFVVVTQTGDVSASPSPAGKSATGTSTKPPAKAKAAQAKAALRSTNDKAKTK
jgi:subtilisin family serine protease